MGHDQDPYGFGVFDGGSDRWDTNHDGKLDILEENARYAHDEALAHQLYGDGNKSDDKEQSGTGNSNSSRHSGGAAGSGVSGRAVFYVVLIWAVAILLWISALN